MLDQLITLKEKPHNVIFIETKFCNVNQAINHYLKAIVCDKTPYCNQCPNCKKIDDQTYIDLIQLNGYAQSIKKEDILIIQDQFAKTASEKANKKIYVIQGVENTTPEALNSLLKFLEEPNSDNIYAIFTTKNINQVLPTIRSRCLQFYLDSDKKNFASKINGLKKYSDEEKTLILKVFNNEEEFKQEVASEDYATITKYLKNLRRDKNNPAKVALLANEFKSFDYLFIQKLLTYLRAVTIKNQHRLVQLIKRVHLTPTKILIFNEILNIVRNE